MDPQIHKYASIAAVFFSLLCSLFTAIIVCTTSPTATD